MKLLEMYVKWTRIQNWKKPQKYDFCRVFHLHFWMILLHSKISNDALCPGDFISCAFSLFLSTFAIPYLMRFYAMNCDSGKYQIWCYNTRNLWLLHVRNKNRARGCMRFTKPVFDILNASGFSQEPNKKWAQTTFLRDSVIWFVVWEPTKFHCQIFPFVCVILSPSLCVLCVYGIYHSLRLFGFISNF